jgi:adenylosuccinate synthase
MTHTEPSARRATGLAVVGLQWGDEGKGKIVDMLADRHDAVVRYNGGANAGHSVVVKGERFALHLIPAGILHKGKPAVVGNGVVIDPDWLARELDALHARGVDTSGLVISDRAHVVMPWHKAEDELRERWLSEGSLEPIGTTKRGIGPCYADKALRGTAIRVGDLLHPETLKQRLTSICKLKSAMLGAIASDQASVTYKPEVMLELCLSWGERFRSYIRDTSSLLLGLLDQHKNILFEGANATLLDVDHGTYPFVTSSTCSALGIPSGCGVPTHAIGEILGVMKAYSTRVGGGAMPTELIANEKDKAIGDRIRQIGREFGTTTGRPRRVGWLDLVAVKYSARLNGVTGLSVMLLDVLAGLDELRICTHYEVEGKKTEQFIADGYWLAKAKPVYVTVPGFGGELQKCRRLNELPSGARAYIDTIAKCVGVPVKYVSVGPDREQTIEVQSEK